jgi:NtrC-family two-component system sensor histidine kinase KinB
LPHSKERFTPCQEPPFCENCTFEDGSLESRASGPNSQSNMNTLSRKLAFSYGLLIIILLAVSAWGVYHFVRLGKVVDVILVNNYRSIVAAENMKEALEREDSSAMFFASGHADKARRQFAASSAAFSRELDIAANNITEPGEAEIVRDIRTKYSEYSREIDLFLKGGSGVLDHGSDFYFQRLEPDFLSLKNRLDDLLHINQDAMVAASNRARAESWRARISTMVVAGLGLALAAIFAVNFTRYVVRPINALTAKAKSIAEGDYDQHIDIVANDEIGALAAEFNRMAARLRDGHKSDYWRLLLEQKKTDAAINAIYEPVIVTDARGTVIRLNRAAGTIFGKTQGAQQDGGEISLAGSDAGERILAAVRDAVAMQRPVDTQGEALLVPIKVDGAERSYRLRTTTMRDEDGRLVGAVTVLEDVTSTADVGGLKSEFISVASGKLREPLHSLRLALHAVLEGHTGELTESQKEMLYVARRGAEQLDEMTSDLLELAELESGARKLEFVPLRPIDLARAAIERQRSAAECKRVRLSNKVWSDLPRVEADKEAIRRVLDNLLSNAIRHTERDGEVSIEAWERNNRVFFSVRDTGQGIPEEYLPNIFGRFVRVAGRPGGGTGLGLAIVKRLVEAEHGQISVESRSGQGAVFTFTLPVSGAAGVLRLEKQA